MLTLEEFLQEAKARENNVLAVYPGRFHPFHLGHKKLYDVMKQHTPFADHVIATSDKTELPDSPFHFQDKAKMMKAAGVPADEIHKAKAPYQLQNDSEIQKKYSYIIYGISGKDMGEDPRFSFKPKKDGTPSYFQPFKGLDKMKTLDKHGYIITLPTVKFNIAGKSVNSGSEIRAAFFDGTDEKRATIIKDLYGKSDKELKNIFDKRLGTSNIRNEMKALNIFSFSKFVEALEKDEKFVNLDNKEKGENTLGRVNKNDTQTISWIKNVTMSKAVNELMIKLCDVNHLDKRLIPDLKQLFINNYIGKNPANFTEISNLLLSKANKIQLDNKIHYLEEINKPFEPYFQPDFFTQLAVLKTSFGGNIKIGDYEYYFALLTDLIKGKTGDLQRPTGNYEVEIKGTDARLTGGVGITTNNALTTQASINKVLKKHGLKPLQIATKYITVGLLKEIFEKGQLAKKDDYHLDMITALSNMSPPGANYAELANIYKNDVKDVRDFIFLIGAMQIHLYYLATHIKCLLMVDKTNGKFIGFTKLNNVHDIYNFTKQYIAISTTWGGNANSFQFALK